jgi:hypothetical protein
MTVHFIGAGPGAADPLPSGGVTWWRAARCVFTRDRSCRGRFWITARRARASSIRRRWISSATVFAAAVRACVSGLAPICPANMARAAILASPRLEWRSSLPCASLVIFATPPAMVTHDTGWARRYFNMPPAKSPMSISAMSGRACSAWTAASDVRPVAPAICVMPLARATSMPCWMPAIQAAQEYGTTTRVVPRIDNPPRSQVEGSAYALPIPSRRGWKPRRRNRNRCRARQRPWPAPPGSSRAARD